MRRQASTERWAAILAIAAFCPPAAPQTEPHDEDRVKAAVVLQLARFVEWPPAVSPSPAFGVCLAAKDSWINLLEHAAKGQTVDGKPIRIQRITGPEDIPACHLAIVGPGVRPNLRAAIDRAPILTIGDEQGFAAHGGMVGLAVQNGRVVFELAPANARRKGIRFSSKLIRLARIVGREAQP